MTSSKNKSNFWWYIAAATVIIIIVAIFSYEFTLPPASTPSSSPSPSVTPSTSPTNASSSPSPSSSPSTSSSPSPSSSSTGTSITLYAGSVTSGSATYGYGMSSSNIVSPGPTLNLKKGTTNTITVNNVGNIPHSFEIVSSKAVSSSPLFGAGIDITSYISPGSSGSVTFTPDQTGNFYYVCTVPGHITLGMWGNVVVS